MTFHLAPPPLSAILFLGETLSPLACLPHPHSLPATTSQCWQRGCTQGNNYDAHGGLDICKHQNLMTSECPKPGPIIKNGICITNVFLNFIFLVICFHCILKNTGIWCLEFLKTWSFNHRVWTLPLYKESPRTRRCDRLQPPVLWSHCSVFPLLHWNSKTAPRIQITFSIRGGWRSRSPKYHWGKCELAKKKKKGFERECWQPCENCKCTVWFFLKNLSYIYTCTCAQRHMDLK